MNKAGTKQKMVGAGRELREVIPGIVSDARRLGVSRMHLWAVLTGRRRSPELAARYAALKGTA